MRASNHFKPGERCPRSGQYEVVNPDGTKTGKEIALSRGERFPPTPDKGQTYVLVDPTRTGEDAVKYRPNDQNRTGRVNGYSGIVFGLVFVLLSIAALVLVGLDRLQAAVLVVFPLAGFFPTSAIAYHLFRRETRIRKLGRDFWLLGIDIRSGLDLSEKSSDQPLSKADRESVHERWSRLTSIAHKLDPWSRNAYESHVREQYTTYHAPWNYAVQSTLAAILTIVGLALFFWPPSGNGLVNENTLQAMRYGFLGAYIFSAQLVYRRYRTLDLQPSVYMNCTLTLIAGIAFNFVVFTAVSLVSPTPPVTPTPTPTPTPTTTGLEGAVLAIVAFSLGYFPYLAIRWFNRVAHTTLGMQQRRADALPLGLIDGISQLHETRLQDEGIDNVQNLASVALDELLLNTRFSAQEVAEWVDQAILYVYLDSAELETFRRAGVRSLTDFQDQWEPHYAGPVSDVAEEKRAERLAHQVRLAELERQVMEQRRKVKLAIPEDPQQKALLEYLEEELRTKKQELEAKQNEFERARKERALLFQVLPERLDALYCATRKGPNVAHIENYWKRAEWVQEDVGHAQEDERWLERRFRERFRAWYFEDREQLYRLILAGKKELRALPPEDRSKLLSSLGVEDEWETEWETEVLSPDALVGKGWVASEMGDYDTAAAAYERAIELDPNRADALAGKGWVARERGDYDTAIAAYERAIKLDPSHTAARNDLAWLYVDILDQNYGEALELATEAVKLSEEQDGVPDPYYLDTLALVHIKLNDPDKGVELTERAIKITADQGDPPDPYYLELLTTAAAKYIELGNLEKAEKTLRRVQKEAYIDQATSDRVSDLLQEIARQKPSE